MSDAERIAALEERITQLESALRGVMLSTLQVINLNRSLITRNGLNRDITMLDKPIDAWMEYGEIFDELIKRFKAFTDA